jgi:hypothetical protein
MEIEADRSIRHKLYRGGLRPPTTYPDKWDNNEIMLKKTAKKIFYTGLFFALSGLGVFTTIFSIKNMK